MTHFWYEELEAEVSAKLTRRPHTSLGSWIAEVSECLIAMGICGPARFACIGEDVRSARQSAALDVASLIASDQFLEFAEFVYLPRRSACIPVFLPAVVFLRLAERHHLLSLSNSRTSVPSLSGLRSRVSASRRSITLNEWITDWLRFQSSVGSLRRPQHLQVIPGDTHTERHEDVQFYADLARGKRVFEVGAGSGRLSRVLRAHSSVYLACDRAVSSPSDDTAFADVRALHCIPPVDLVVMPYNMVKHCFTNSSITSTLITVLEFAEHVALDWEIPITFVHGRDRIVADGDSVFVDIGVSKPAATIRAVASRYMRDVHIRRTAVIGMAWTGVHVHLVGRSAIQHG